MSIDDHSVLSRVFRRRTFHALVLGLVILLAPVGVTPVHAAPVFVAHLDGSQEVPPNLSTASGTATFEFDAVLGQLSFELVVANLVDVVAAHIHLAPAGVNGPVIAFLYAGPPAGAFSGVLATGIITAADFVGQFAGEPIMFLIDAMLAHNAYVNVHTELLPAGEIRGQISPVSEPGALAVVGFCLLLLGGVWLGRASRRVA